MKKNHQGAFLILLQFSIALIALPQPQKSPMTIRQMISLETIGKIAISPSGDLVAFEVISVDWKNNAYRTHIWLASTDGRRCFPVTRGEDTNSDPAWSPDGQVCSFISSRIADKPQIFLFRPGYGEPEPLFETEQAVQEFAWAPDGKSIAFLSPEPADEKKVEMIKNGFDEIEIDESPSRSRLYLYDLKSRKIRSLVHGNFHIVSFSWSPDSRNIVFITSPKNLEEIIWENQTMWIINKDGGLPRTINFGYKAYMIFTNSIKPIWNPDGQSFAIAAGDLNNPGLYCPSILIYNLKSDSSFNASGANDHFIYDYPQWSTDGRFVYYLAYISQNSQFIKLDTVTKRAEQVSHFSKIDIRNFSVAADRHSMVFSGSTPSSPQELYFGDISAPDNVVRITNLHPVMECVDVGREEEISWRSEDGLMIHGHIVYPIGYENGKKYPTLLLVHGGPLGNYPNGFAASYMNPAQYFAGKGYLVLLPNPRGSIGWGSEFMRKNIRDWGGGDYKDLMAGLDYLIKKGLADANKLFVWGGSYGGYMTNWIVTHTNRFKAAHSEVSISDLFSLWSTAPHGRISCRMWFIKNPLEDPDIYRKLSPITYAKMMKTPLLMTQNEKDQRAPVTQAIEFYRAVELTGTPVRLYIYPNEPHRTLKPIHALDKLMKTEWWFYKYLN